MPRKRSLPAAAPLAETNEKFRRTLEEAMRTGSRYSSDFAAPAALVMVPNLVSKIFASHEHETLKKVVATWQELAAWADARSLQCGHLTAAEVALFVQSSKAPSRVIPALQFLTKNLYVDLDLTLAIALRQSTRSALGIGQRQAPVAQPAMLAKLEEGIAAAIVMENPKWLGLYAMWCVASGCIKWQHVQCSRLVQITEHTMVFECARGEQRLKRCGFYWPCPRRSCVDGHDFGQAFQNVAENLPADFSAVAFELGTLQEIPHRVAKSQVALLLAQELQPEELNRSLRRAGVR